MNNQEFMNQWFDAQKKLAEQWQSMLPSMGNEQNAGFQKMMEAQQKMFNDWAQAFNPSSSTASNPFAMFTPFAMPNNPMNSFMESQKEMFEGMQKAYQDSPVGAYISQFPDLNTYMENFRSMYDPTQLIKMMDSDSFKTIAKAMDANRNFVSFYRYFDSLKDTYGKPFEEDGKKLMEKWVADSEKFYGDFVEPFIPAQVRDLLQAPKNLAETMQGSFTNILGPWAGSFAELSRLYVEGANGDTDKLADFFALWKANYQKTIAPLFKMPGMGNNTEKIESQNAFIDQTMQLILTGVEFQQKLSQVSQNRVKELIQEYEELIKKDEQPKTYKEFYDYWTGEIEKTLKDYFFSDEFAVMLSEFGQSNAQFIIARNKVMEIALRNTPIVVESDARSLYKKVHDLKRDVNNLKRELKALKEDKGAEDTKETAKTTTTRRRTSTPRARKTEE